MQMSFREMFKYLLLKVELSSMYVNLSSRCFCSTLLVNSASICHWFRRYAKAFFITYTFFFTQNPFPNIFLALHLCSMSHIFIFSVLIILSPFLKYFHSNSTGHKKEKERKKNSTMITPHLFCLFLTIFTYFL